MPNLSPAIGKGFKYEKAEQQCINISKNLHKEIKILRMLQNNQQISYRNISYRLLTEEAMSKWII